MTTDVRWRQRLQNFERAVEVLVRVCDAADADAPSEVERLALIQAFEMAHELSWLTLKDLLEFEGVTGLVASRSTVREAYAHGLLEDGQVWMDMITDRNRTSHLYDESVAAAVAMRIAGTYRSRFTSLAAALRARANAEDA
ncbi:MAG: hypothetical protein RL562_1363 [Planctomycetota bacterium]